MGLRLLFPLIIRLVLFIPSFHQEVASGPFCLLVNSLWPLIFALCLFFLSLSGFNLYCWKGIHFSWSLDLIFFCLFFIFILNFWYRDLLREFYKKYEVLFMVLFLLFFLFLLSDAAISLGNAFISLEISSSFLIFFSLFSFI